VPTRNSKRPADFAALAGKVASRLKPPFLIVLGSPREAVELAAQLPSSDITCFQLDLFQADRTRRELAELGVAAEVVAGADLWDLPAKFQTAIFPVPFGGERQLKLDMVEQAYHVLAPQGTFIVLSPYERDDFFAGAMKKIFGRSHCPQGADRVIYWSQVGPERPRRRHEVAFQVRVDETTSLRFLSRPGTFSYGKMDFGARALVEAVLINEGDRIADLGCGIGTNGIIASRAAGPNGFVGFADSNLRALALAEINAKALGVPNFQTFASHALLDLPPASFDVVLANPPYFANLSIARLFMQRGKEILKPGGRFALVTKQIEAVHPMMEEVFGECDIGELRGYYIFEAVVK
jgi:16S rRNA G1207 methylase RsmC